MDLLATHSFRITTTGDSTGQTWLGDFTCLKRLSHRQELTRDRYYRELLGPNPEGASERAKSQAELFSDLKVCLKDTPAWWKESGDGLDLADDNVVREIWQETVKARVEAVAEIKQRAVEAETKLKNPAE